MLCADQRGPPGSVRRAAGRFYRRPVPLPAQGSYIRRFGGWQTTFRISTTPITAGGAGYKIPLTRPHCGSRPKIRHITGASLLSSAELSCGLRSQTATPILRGAVCIAAGRIWPPICWRCFRASCPLLSPGPKPAAEKATQGMTRLLLRHSKKQPKPASGQQ